MNSRFSRDTLWLIAAQAVLMIAGFGVNLVIGNLQGADALGVFNQALAFYTILSTFFALGLNNTITKKIAEGQRSAEETQRILVSNLFVTTLFSGMLSALVCLLAIQQPTLFSSSELARVVYIPMIALPFFNINKNFGAYFTGLRLQKRFAQQRILRWTIIISFVSISVAWNNSIESALWCFFAAEFSLFILNTFQLGRRIKLTIDKATIAENLRFGMKTYAAELISVLNASLDVILIGYFLTNAETGIYSFVVYFAKTLYIFPGIMMQNFSPIISKTWASGNRDELLTKMKSIKKINTLVVSLQLVALLIAYPLITMCVKKEFSGTFWLFSITSLGAFIFSLIAWSGSMLIMTNNLNRNIQRVAMIIIFSAVSSIVLTSLYGLPGACIGYCLNAIMSYAATSQHIKLALNIRV
ncbi:MAG: oligosaccharide flippase family protein [Flavobacteriales bacterium]